MNKTTSHQTSVYPQTVEIPEPLEVHPSISPLAAELLMKTAEILARTPDQYDQSHISKCYSDCGTACCIVGHMGALIGLTHVSTYEHATLGLTSEQADAICWAERWPACVRAAGNAYHVSNIQGIARINHFLSTGQ